MGCGASRRPKKYDVVDPTPLVQIPHSQQHLDPVPLKSESPTEAVLGAAAHADVSAEQDLEKQVQTGYAEVADDAKPKPAGASAQVKLDKEQEADSQLMQHEQVDQLPDSLGAPKQQSDTPLNLETNPDEPAASPQDTVLEHMDQHDISMVDMPCDGKDVTASQLEDAHGSHRTCPLPAIAAKSSEDEPPTTHHYKSEDVEVLDLENYEVKPTTKHEDSEVTNAQLLSQREQVNQMLQNLCSGQFKSEKPDSATSSKEVDGRPIQHEQSDKLLHSLPTTKKSAEFDKLEQNLDEPVASPKDVESRPAQHEQVAQLLQSLLGHPASGVCPPPAKKPRVPPTPCKLQEEQCQATQQDQVAPKQQSLLGHAASGVPPEPATPQAVPLSQNKQSQPAQQEQAGLGCLPTLSPLQEGAEDAFLVQSDYTHVQFIAYEICTKPRAPYHIVEAEELPALLAAVAEEGAPILNTDVHLADGLLRTGVLIKARYCPRMQTWIPVSNRSHLQLPGWCALRCCNSTESAEKRWRCDVAARARLVREALETAAGLAGIDSSPGTLKVFAAPEFMFRGPDGVREQRDILGDPHDGLAAILQELVAAAKWKHWQFLFGTAFGNIASGTAGNSQESTEVYNMAILQAGGFVLRQNGPKHCSTFLKRHQNGIDFLQRGIGLEVRAAASAPLAKHCGAGTESMLQVLRNAMQRSNAEPAESKAAAGLSGGAGGIFQLAGRSWGVEVCLDHSMSSLKKELRADPEKGLLDVQLVVSCGMDVRNGSVAVRSGGLVFLCDGLHGEPYGAHSSAFLWGQRGPLESIPVRESIDAHGDNWKSKLDPFGDGDLFSTSFPEAAVGPLLRVYEPVPLPIS